MLEEALKRDHPDQGKDVGWRRWSSKENQRRSEEEQSRESISPGFPPNGPRADSLPVDAMRSPQPQLHPTPSNTPASYSTPPPTSTPAPESSRFFKFRLRGASRSPSLGGTHSRSAINSPTTANGLNTSHLTSASLPSLVLPEEQEAAKKEAELNEQLEDQRRKYETLAGEKAALESELESLSQALFEEVIGFLYFKFQANEVLQANKMVATERIKLAEADDELRSTLQEKEALKSALKLIEQENDRLRQHISEKADPASSEDNTERTLLSVKSLEAKLGEMNAQHEQALEMSRQSQSRRSLDSSEEDHTPIEQTESTEHTEHSEDELAEGINESESGDTVTPLAEVPPIPNTTSPPPRVENPWTSFFVKDSNHGLVTHMG